MAQRLIQRVEDAFEGPVLQLSRLLQQGRGLGHVQRGGEALAAHIAHGGEPFAAGALLHEEQVAPRFQGGFQAQRQLEPGHLRGHAGDEAFLDLAGGVQLLGGALLIHEALVHDGGFQDHAAVDGCFPEQVPVLAAIGQLRVLAAQENGRVGFLRHHEQQEDLSFQRVHMGAEAFALFADPIRFLRAEAQHNLAVVPGVARQGGGQAQELRRVAFAGGKQDRVLLEGQRPKA